VRSSHSKLAEFRKVARRYQNQILPLLKKTITETQRYYNFMLRSPFDLLQAKKEEIHANREYIEALREYWTGRARLERAVGVSWEGMQELPKVPHE
jgi:cobalt-zinc-cadmium efflux system outer membrane protein